MSREKFAFKVTVMKKQGSEMKEVKALLPMEAVDLYSDIHGGTEVLLRSGTTITIRESIADLLKLSKTRGVFYEI